METIQRKTLLVADDDNNSLRLMLQAFKEAGAKYDILHAPNGKVACELAYQNMPDLILMDWNMPVMTGLEAVKRLKAEPKTSEIPIIIVTGVMIDDLNLDEAFQTGAVDYLRKPINAIELVARVRNALSLADANQRLKQIYKNDLEHKKRELATNSIQIAQKTEVLNELKELIDTLPASSIKQEAIRVIERNIQLDGYWDRFKMHFDEVHPDFFSRLQTSFPDISQNELKHCAYIKMRLASKEIAQLTNISVKGMETARYRLKKKLNLSAEQDMNDFIQNF
ncbi:MAG: response regulator [Bacteroidetes bacterium]|nr:MAG: response regulator [Bacteroidota bacterium]